eukprot:CAMPEP_0172652478 /NCGR_PEP_ID=MMETSP1068-20121228/243334_1 /TAXON_ID=35684 /ORGANISM="Pseudopedinella elastica, Strain CCMP716" /LENGTH=664 /DNA_ID=CAMNT_0013466885 /DNA_START=22 /DNA_END=2017 /DNA_ORIENTATION=-
MRVRARARPSGSKLFLLAVKVWSMTLASYMPAHAADAPTVSVGKLRSDADAALISGDVDKSVKLMNQVIEMEPNNEQNYLKRYRANMRRRKLKEAFSDLTQALNINPKLKSALGNRAKLGASLGRCQEAVADLKALRTVDEKAKELAHEAKARECSGHLSRAGTLEQQGDLGGACLLLALWVASGLPLAGLWLASGLPLACLWVASGLPLAGLWVALWVASGLPLACPYRAGTLEQQGDLGGAWDALNAAMEAGAESSHDLLLRRAQIEVLTGDYYESVASSGRAIKLEADSIQALGVRGRAYYLLGEHEMALNHWRQALHFDPEHEEVKGHYRILKKLEKQEKRALKLEAAGDLEGAVEAWRAAIAVDAAHKRFVARASLATSKILVKIKKYSEAADSCQEALNQELGGEEKLEALLLMGEVMLGWERFEEAVRWCGQALELGGDQRAKEALHKAKVALKQSKEVDHYKVLGVTRTASQKDIKKAYRTAALIHHPDKVPEEERDKAEQEFMKIAAAYEVLSDDELRAKYDRGEDVSGMGRAAGQAATGPAPITSGTATSTSTSTSVIESPDTARAQGRSTSFLCFLVFSGCVAAISALWFICVGPGWDVPRVLCRGGGRAFMQRAAGGMGDGAQGMGKKNKTRLFFVCPFLGAQVAGPLGGAL